MLLRLAISRIVFVILLALTMDGIAQVEGSASFSMAGTTEEALGHFLGKLQKAVAADDRATVATLVRFPLRAWNGKKTVSIPGKRELLTHYDAIFTANLKQTIAHANTARAFANWQGVMFESGRIWIRAEENNSLRLVTINPPAEKP